MNKVYLKSILIENFKGIAKAEFEFEEGENKIVGENGSGKTSIKNAFEWLLCQNVSDFLPMLNNKEIPSLTTYVKAVLNINGFDYTFERTSKGKYKLNEETNTMNKITNESTYKIDEIEFIEKNYKAKLADLLGNGTFENLQILIDREFFNTDATKFKWDNRRKILFEMCGVQNAVKDLVLKSQYEIIKDDLIKGYATSDIKSRLKKEKQGYKDQQLKNNILIEQKTKEITELSAIDFEQVEKDLKTAKAKLNKLLTATQKESENERLNEFQDKLLKLNKEKSQLEMQDMNEQNALRKFVNTSYNECQDLKTQYQIEKDKLNDLINSRIDSEAETECPACHRPYDEETQKKASEEIKALLEENDKLVEKQTEVVQEIQEKYNAKKAQFDTTKAKLDNFKQNERLIEVNNAILSVLDDLQDEKNKNLNKLSNEQQIALETQISGLERELAKQAFVDKAKQNISNWKEQNKSLADKIVLVERKENALADYVKEQIETINSTVNEKFSNGISWALYKEIYKNGEGGIEEDCTCMFNGKRFSSLSMGEKNKANIEVIKTLQNYFGIRLPIFADNAETTTLEYDINTQIIELYAQKDCKIENIIKIEDVYKEKDNG